MIRIAVVSLAVIFGFQQTVHAALVVYTDFTTDIGNGAGGAANGTADWIDNLNALTTAAGVAAFTPTERTSIETSIVSKLGTMYGSYNVTFSTTTPGGSHERINFGAYSGTPGALGVAPLDFMNLSASTGFESSAARVYSNNFSYIIESGDARATQIAELATALAGTGGHELGHSVGLQHHHAYGDQGITPADYGNTGDVQNSHVIATGSTGLSETGRETDRTFSQMSNLMLEAAGGANGGVFGMTGTALATTVLAQTDSDYTSGDTGNTAGTATALALTSLPISGLDAAHTLGDLATAGDLDFYSFTIASPGQLFAQIWSDDRYANDFDTRLRLFDTDGISVLGDNDNILYDGNVFGSGTLREEDSALLNISLSAAGTYFLEVSNLGPVIGEGETDDGGVYSLIFGVDMTVIPEPGSLALLVSGAIVLGIGGFRRRRRSGQATR